MKDNVWDYLGFVAVSIVVGILVTVDITGGF